MAAAKKKGDSPKKSNAPKAPPRRKTPKKQKAQSLGLSPSALDGATDAGDDAGIRGTDADSAAPDSLDAAIALRSDLRCPSDWTPRSLRS